MSNALRQLCILSVLSGAAMSVMPEGGVKRITAMLMPCVLIISLLMPLKDFDFDTYAMYAAKYRKMSDELDSRSLELNKNLNRLVIEEKCEAYIMDKAAESGTELTAVDVSVQWSTEGCWVPYSVTISGASAQTEQERLKEQIIAELGIPAERQEWRQYG